MGGPFFGMLIIQRGWGRGGRGTLPGPQRDEFPGMQAQDKLDLGIGAAPAQTPAYTGLLRLLSQPIGAYPVGKSQRPQPELRGGEGFPAAQTAARRIRGRPAGASDGAQSPVAASHWKSIGKAPCASVHSAVQQGSGEPEAGLSTAMRTASARGTMVW